MGGGRDDRGVAGVPGVRQGAGAREWTYHHTGVLADSTVLIVGYGSIGEALERRLAGFEVEIVRVARSARENVHGQDELPELLPGRTWWCCWSRRRVTRPGWSTRTSWPR
nr:hypothetical protein GCM10020093_056290 [Planobispora longispora]